MVVDFLVGIALGVDEGKRIADLNKQHMKRKGGSMTICCDGKEPLYPNEIISFEHFEGCYIGCIRHLLQNEYYLKYVIGSLIDKSITLEELELRFKGYHFRKIIEGYIKEEKNQTLIQFFKEKGIKIINKKRRKKRKSKRTKL